MLGAGEMVDREHPARVREERSEDKTEPEERQAAAAQYQPTRIMPHRSPALGNGVTRAFHIPPGRAGHDRSSVAPSARLAPMRAASDANIVVR